MTLQVFMNQLLVPIISVYMETMQTNDYGLVVFVENDWFSCCMFLKNKAVVIWTMNVYIVSQNRP